MDTPSRSAFALDFACALSVAPLLSIAAPDAPLASIAAIGAASIAAGLPLFEFAARRGRLLTPGLWLNGLRRNPGESRWVRLFPAEETALRAKIGFAAALVVPLASLALAFDAHAILGGLLPEERIEARADVTDRPLPWFLFTLQVPAAPATETAEPFVARLPYAPGIPRRFIPSVEFRLPDGSLRMVIDAPRRPAGWNAELASERVARCFSRAELWDTDCILQRERLVAHARVRLESALGPRVSAAGLRSTESGSWKTPLSSGFFARFRSPLGRLEFRAAVTSEGDLQGWMIFVQRDAVRELQEVAARLPAALARGATPFRDLRASRGWLDAEIRRIRLPSASAGAQGAVEAEASDVGDVRELRREFDALSLVQVALLSKLSVEPSSYDAFFHLAGTSFLKWKLSRKLGLPRHGAAALALVESSSRYLADLRAMDPRTRQIEDLLGRMKSLAR